MSNYPIFKIYTCKEDVSNVEYVDISFATANFTNIPKITISVDANINVFVSDVTETTARINFSTKFTGTVRYSAISMI